ncbi:uncharacterized protein TEOVI_000907000 [Trypanosoma equiperdum]|uniref:Uncharacterized protein n=3 Tax=Trypanozoon TaxID=39700 RepID=Q57U28_TRYB2|nr:hypothetical protein, conserved [Trypanosoma brucei brucei TREU927]AAX70890.1 hypothetical protein, conserved [Trypanosoma brucei]AAZ12091.1 hypothetical protein, conserved [Trypanosoma brucei brucei TREU927]RHW71696.1 hypothetical protein DPX39_070013900 [Trypanosoma brucei equiperdum]SCU66758.1 hypothetical protein, conserved [Trypanosoma equiperdum]
MTERSPALVPAVSLLREELQLLNGVVEGQARSRVYRHHIFFRKASFLRSALRNALPQFARRAADPTDLRTVAGRLLTLTIRCAESATLELSASHIDTVSVALLLLAITSRIGCVLCVVLGRKPETFGKLHFIGSKFGVKYKRSRSEAELAEETIGVATPIRRRTIGGVIEAVIK